jgi:hypothetical protein
MTDVFSDERDQAIRASFDRSRETIQRVDATIAPPLTAMERVEQWADAMPSDARAIMRWLDQMPELPKPERSPPEIAPKEAPMIRKSHSKPPVDVAAAWSEHVKQQINDAIGSFAGNFAQMLGEEAAKHDKALRSEIADLQKQLKALSDEVAVGKVTRLKRYAS